MLFSGTVFWSVGDRLQVEPIAWHTEARYRLPVATWRDLMDKYFPNGGWLRLPHETIDALGAFKAREALPTFEQAIELLLRREGAGS